jgi:hypothetical protein
MPVPVKLGPVALNRCLLDQRDVFLNEPLQTTSDPLPCATIVMSKVMDLVTWPV